MTTLKRRIQAAHTPIEREWRRAWISWAGASLKLLKEFDPLAGEKVHTLLNPLYREWAKAYLSGESPAFLSRGAVMTKWWAEAPALWEWLWATQEGWIAQDLRMWPSQLPEPPEFPSEALDLLLTGANSAEDFALIIAVAQAQTQLTSRIE